MVKQAEKRAVVLEKRGSVSGFPTLGSGCTDIIDFLSVGIRISYRWVPRNRVGAFILRSEDPTAIRRWPPTGVNVSVGGQRCNNVALDSG